MITGETFAATVSVGGIPFGVAYNGGNGYVYVTNWGSCTVRVIDGTTVIATIPVGTYPYAVGYDSGNGDGYVSNSNNGTVITGAAVGAPVPAAGGGTGGAAETVNVYAC